jgi:ubiquitin C-terminal hydrolase
MKNFTTEYNLTDINFRYNFQEAFNLYNPKNNTDSLSVQQDINEFLETLNNIFDMSLFTSIKSKSKSYIKVSDRDINTLNEIKLSNFYKEEYTLNYNMDEDISPIIFIYEQGDITIDCNIIYNRLISKNNITIEVNDDKDTITEESRNSIKELNSDDNVKKEQIMNMQENLGKFYYISRNEKIISTYPKVLYIYINNVNYSNKKLTLININIIAVQEKIDLNNNIYNLQSIIFHVGLADSGHYICYFKCDGKWYEYNDDNKVSNVANDYTTIDYRKLKKELSYKIAGLYYIAE